MKIAITALGRRGAGPMYSFEMAKALSANHSIFAVVSAYAENIQLWREEEKSNPNFSILEVNTYTTLASFLIQTLNFTRYTFIAKRINEFSPDILYSPFGNFWDKFIFSRVKCPTKVKTYHDMTMHEGENHWYLGLLYSSFSFHTDKCVILSDVFVDTMVEKYNYAREDIIVIPHASFKQYSDNKQPDMSTKFGLMFFGRQVKYKGLNVMLKALRLIIKDIPQIKLYIVGNGDITYASKEIEELKDNIVLQNRWIKDDEVSEFFQQTDIAVLPYIEASQSGVIPLANSFGNPAIASDIGGLPAQINNNVSGLVVPVNNPAVLANAIIQLYHDESRLVAMKRAAWQYSIDNSWEKSAQKLVEVCIGTLTKSS